MSGDHHQRVRAAERATHKFAKIRPPSTAAYPNHPAETPCWIMCWNSRVMTYSGEAIPIEKQVSCNPHWNATRADRRVLLNLMINTIKASPRGGFVMSLKPQQNRAG